ncbi:hypothetical protein [Parvibaculum sp.]|uniref:COG4223 family protein n=1 Tax=Parvibaculum sp. TaxID=2024848 RepID=UPI00320EA976
MTDANGNKETPASPEAEVLGPEKAQPGPRPRKEPPVIDGEAEVLSSKTGAARPEADPQPASPGAEVPLAKQARSVGLGTVIVIALAAAVAVGAAGYVVIGQMGDASGQALAGLGTRLDAIEQKSEASGQSLAAATEKLDTRIAAAEQTLAQQSPESIAAANARLDKLAAETDALKQSLAEAQSASQGTQQKLDELGKSLPPAGIADQVAKVEAMLRLLNGALDQLTPKVDAMEARLAALEAKKEDPDAAARAALGLALANLARVAEGSGSFKAELDAVAAFLPNEPELSGLAQVAAQGAVTRARLKEEFPDVAQKVFDAERRATSDGFWARFVANARSLVTVRRTGELTGDSTEAVIARMEERLKLDDLAGAADEAVKLKGPAMEAMKPWLDRAQARIATDRLVRDLSAHVAARLTTAAGGNKG